MQSFKEYLQPYSIFCDMDGTLVDFEVKAKEVLGLDDIHSIPEEEFWERLSPKHIKNFFGNLDWLPGSQHLWNAIKPYNPTILTATSNQWAIPQKRQWVQIHLGQHVPIIFTRSSLKQVHAGPNRILIDDRADIIHNWKKKHGIGIHFTNAQKAISELNQYLHK